MKDTSRGRLIVLREGREAETARAIVRHHANRNSNRLTFPLSFDDLIAEIAAALRNRADEATEACALYLEDQARKHNHEADLLEANGDHGEGEAEEISQHRTDATMLHLHAAAIRARIKP
jgi:hypothetical protein